MAKRKPSEGRPDFRFLDFRIMELGESSGFFAGSSRIIGRKDAKKLNEGFGTLEDAKFCTDMVNIMVDRDLIDMKRK